MGSRIKEYILKAGLKQNVIAERAGIPESIFSAILNNKRKITVDEYFAICDALNVSIVTFKGEPAGQPA